MKENEEELQKRIESGKLQGLDEAEVKAYQLVFRALEKEPDGDLSPGFADKIVALATARQKSKSTFREYLWLGLGIFGLFVAALITIGMMHYSFDLGFLKGLKSYTGVLFFGAAFIIMLHFLDRKLIRPKDTAI